MDHREVTDILFSTYPHYQDQESRRAVEGAFLSLIEKNKDENAVLKAFSDNVGKIVQVREIAIVDVMTVLEWSSAIISNHPSADKAHLQSIIQSQACLLEKILSRDSLKRGRLQGSAIRSVKSSMVTGIAKNFDLMAVYFDALLVKSHPRALAHFISLSCLAGAGMDLLPVVPAASKTVEEKKPEIYNLYIQTVLGSKTALSQNIVDSFTSFFSDYTTQADFDDVLVPAIGKSMLRAPEIVLVHIVPTLIQNLSPLVDVGKALKDKLLTSFLSGFGSSNGVLRDSSLKTLTVCLSHCYSAEELDAISSNISTALKKITSADQRIYYGKALAAVPCGESRAKTIPGGVLPSAAKEVNETALEQLSGAVSKHLVYGLINEVEPEKTTVDGVIKALGEKKANLRRIWICSVVKEFLEVKKLNDQVSAFIDSILPSLKSTFDEIMANPAAAVQNKTVTAGLAFVSLNRKLFDLGHAGDEKVLVNSVKSVNDKQPLLAFRTLSKLATDEECFWAIQALSATSGIISSIDESIQMTWNNVWVYYCLSKNVPTFSRRTAVSKLRDLYEQSPQSIGPIIISGITKMLQSPTALEEGVPTTNLQLIISVLFSQPKQPIDPATLELHLADLAVVSHHPSAYPKNGWIGLVLRTSVDPGVLVENYSDRIIENALKLADSPSNGLFEASCRAIATLSFINPDMVVSKIIDIGKQDLNAQLVEKFTPFNIKVWETPEGEIVQEDEPETKKRVVENKNSKDYETRKWEEDLRKEIASKKGTNAKTPAKKKLTKEEQMQLDEQQTVRKDVNKAVSQLKRGLGLLKALARDAQKVSNGIEQWFPDFYIRMNQILASPNADRLVGKESTDVILELSNCLSARLTLMRPFVGVALLRSLYSDKHLEPSMLQEPLKDLVNRILYRVKFLSDQRPLDSITLTFIVPILLRILYGTKGKGGIATKDEEEIEEQTILALDIIAAHSEEFKDPATPRNDLLFNLIRLMQGNPTKAKQAKECFMSVVQSVSINYSQEELRILLSGVVSGELFVRTAVLEAIDAELDISELKFSSEIWIARFYDENVNSELANDIWAENELSIVDAAQATDAVLTVLGSEYSSLRHASARALAAIVAENPKERFRTVYDKVVELFVKKAKDPEPVYDKFGIAIKMDHKDPWEARSGCASAFRQLAPYFDSNSVIEFINFLITGAAALGDKNPDVRQESQAAGLDVIEAHGLENVEQLIPIFEEYLAKPDSETQDEISESVIILYGALGRHLQSDDPRLIKVVDRLVATLDTPSEDVQVAVCECISPLVKLFKPKLQEYIDTVMKRLLSGEKFAERRGAAYGLAGLVKGAGISALADFDIIRTLSEAVEDKKDPKKRQGAQFAFECLSQALGKFFEPYVIDLVPLILSCLGDNYAEVREAATYGSRVIMRNTTGYGVKKLIPLTLENLDQTAWRAKKGAVELLGSMAYLDPHQLSTSLSTIVPEIVGVLNDSHKEVRNAANQSLKRFGDVIKNPEIQALVPVLIKAIGNPTKYTDEALDGLLKTQFVHYIDAPSLALVVHVLHRGLKDRSAATKKKACQIVGNMSILTDANDLVPYLDDMVAELEIAMVDPVPATRATASRALGSLVEKLGEEQFPDLIPGLLATLKDETRAGDRLGSAQALSEVIYGLGIRKLDELLPTILKSCTSPKSFVREGFMPLMIYLPACFGASMSPYLSQIIPPILNGLADTTEGVRDTSLKAGRLLVKNYSTKAVDLLLPELETGLSNANYRIRLSSVELTGDLLYQVTGITSSGGDEQDTAISGNANKALIEILGQERRDRILSAIFICRTDTSGQVRTSGIEVWKSIVANTPRTVKEILPTLTQLVIKRLASSEEEHRTIGAHALGDLVRRVGGNAMSELLPTLEEGLYSHDSDAKQGICIALSELIQSSPPEALEQYQKTMIRIVRGALVDSNSQVREAAAQAFDVLQENIGDAAVDQIMPDLISSMQSEDSDEAENAFAALKEMMATKSNVVFPILIPTLLTPPMNAFKANALGSLATVSGTALYKRLTSIINAFFDALVSSVDDLEQIDQALDTVLLSVVHEEGTHILMQHLLSLAKNEDSRKREATFRHMALFFKESPLDYSVYTQDWVSICIYALDERDENVVKSAWSALSTLVGKLSKEELERLVKTARQSLRSTGAPGQDLPGFALPKGPNCVLPIFLQGLMYGSSEEREQAALGIADIAERTSAANLKPFVTHMTGPLIRTIGERFPSDVKSAILYTLNVLLTKIPAFLKPFLPQLQRTFAKSLSDPTNEVLRNRAAKALGTLITLQARIDPLVTELINGAKGSTDEGVSVAMHNALSEVVTKAGQNLSAASKDSLVSFIKEQIPEARDGKFRTQDLNDGIY